MHAYSPIYAQCHFNKQTHEKINGENTFEKKKHISFYLQKADIINTCDCQVYNWYTFDKWN